MNLVICGIANPKNAIGPQYAVTIAVRYPEISIIISLVLFMLSPRFSAYRSPNNNVLSVLERNKLAIRPIIIDTE